jgi:hypothetical protein
MSLKEVFNIVSVACLVAGLDVLAFGAFSLASHAQAQPAADYRGIEVCENVMHNLQSCARPEVENLDAAYNKAAQENNDLQAMLAGAFLLVAAGAAKPTRGNPKLRGANL